jgi:hypothetical protein
MAINWGAKIVLFYTGFVLLIGVLVWKSTHTRVDLVTEDYYAQEISFQKKLDAEQATAGLPQKPVMSVTPETIMIFFPQEFSGKVIQADLQLYNPANSALDKTFTKLQVGNGKLNIDRKGLPAAHYTGKLTWTCDGKTYYQEAPLNLALK